MDATLRGRPGLADPLEIQEMGATGHETGMEDRCSMGSIDGMGGGKREMIVWLAEAATSATMSLCICAGWAADSLR